MTFSEPSHHIYPHKTLFYACLGGLLLLSATRVWAQRNHPRFQAVTLEQGLSQSVVNCILQDRRGFLWFGTQDGLNRFDGYRFKVFRPDAANPHALVSGHIYTMLEDREGHLWIGTEGGLQRFDEEGQRFISYLSDPHRSDSLSGPQAMVLHEDSSGRLWVGTLANGLNYLDRDTGRFTHFRAGERSGLAHDQIHAIHEDRQGRLWFGTERGPYLFEPHSLRFNKLRDHVDAPIYTFFEDGEGHLWMGGDLGLYRFDPQNQRFDVMPLPEASRGEAIRTMIQDDHGWLWIGTSGALLKWHLSSGEIMRFSYQQGEPTSIGRDVLSLLLDRSGVLWIGTYSDGLYKLDRGNENFILYQHRPSQPKSLSDNGVRSMLVDRGGELWVGTYGGGLNRLDQTGEGFLVYRPDPEDPDSIADDVILSIAEDRTSRIWVGHLAGISILDKQSGRFAHMQHDPERPSIAGDIVYAIWEDRAGRMWIGSQAGLNRFIPEENRFDHFQHQPDDPRSLVQDDVMSILEDQSGDLWLGTFGGVSRYRPARGKFTNYTPDASRASSLNGSSISDIYEDPAGRIWIATNRGVNRYHPESDDFTTYGVKDGFPNEVIYSVLGDTRGFLWLSTNQGLIQFDPESLAIRHYDVQDGLQSNEFNQGGRAASADGWLFFGGIRGFNAFHPEQIQTNPYVPEVVITELLLLNQAVAPHPANQDATLRQAIHLTQHLVLSHRDYLFSFEFAALNYANSNRNRYAYKLAGFDQDWIETDAGNRRATYTNLAPGDYVFHVKGSNEDGVWNHQGASLRLTITPPFYRTWWAYSLYVILFLGSGPSLYFWRMNKVKTQLNQERTVNEKLHQINRLKDDFLANTSHELRTPLNGIIGLAESLCDGVAGPLPTKAQYNLSLIVSSGQRLSHLVDDILDFSNLKNNTLELRKTSVDLYALTQVVLTLSKPMAHNKNLRLINKIDPELPPVHADENRLQQILYNLVGNALKFTERGSVTVSAEVVEDHVAVHVTDTGIGIGPDESQKIFNSFERGLAAAEHGYPGTGLGLAITRKLVALHGGKISVTSHLEEGTRFTFTLPVFSHQPDATPMPVVEAVELVRATSATPKTPVPVREINPVEPITGAFNFNVLIVDDDPVNRQVLVDLLSLHQYKISQAGNGREALRIIEKGGPFDLVLLDVMMPKMSGYEVCQKLRAKFPVHELPVIFLTAKNQVSDLVTGFDAGANDYITKPISKSELLTRVKTHIKLLDINRNLEQKVAERTRQLHSKNLELASLNQKLEQASLTDPLTGLGNRRYLRKYMEKEWPLILRLYSNKKGERASRYPDDADLVFLLMDLDGFKKINDTYGHGVGDQVLAQIKGLMKQVAREYDIAVRWGGEEFLLVHRKTHRANAPELAKRLHQAVGNHPFEIGKGKTIHITVSIGVACFPFLPSDPGLVGWERVIDIADLGLYLAKQNGRNAWVAIDTTPNTRPHKILTRVRRRLEDMVTAGELTLDSNLPKQGLRFWRPKQEKVSK